MTTHPPSGPGRPGRCSPVPSIPFGGSSGLTGFIWGILAVPMLLWLYWRGSIRVPAGFGIWLLFLRWMAASLIVVDDPTAMLVALHRASLYVSATILFVYVYNLPEGLVSRWWGHSLDSGPTIVADRSAGDRLVLPGVHEPRGRATTAGRAVAERVHRGYDAGPPGSDPRFPWIPGRAPNGAVRLHEPVGIGVRAPRPVRGRGDVVRPWPWRKVGPLLGVMGLIPLIVSLDRGAWLSLTFGGGLRAGPYGIRAPGGQCRTRPARRCGWWSPSCSLPRWAASFKIGIETPHSNRGRLEIYGQVIEGVKSRPIFGYGGPREAEGNRTSRLGTQGSFWLVLYSHGIPGAALFVGFFLMVLWRTRRARTPIAFGSHVVIFIGLAQLPITACSPSGSTS